MVSLSMFKVYRERNRQVPVSCQGTRCIRYLIFSYNDLTILASCRLNSDNFPDFELNPFLLIVKREHLAFS